jgi:hypothetical protein
LHISDLVWFGKSGLVPRPKGGVWRIKMKLKKLKPLLFLIICLSLFSCMKEMHEDSIVNNSEIKAFVAYFFVQGTSLTKNRTENFTLQDQSSQNLLSTADICSPGSPCNKANDYSLTFTPNFVFETVEGRTVILGADPDAFVDVCDLKGKKVYRVRQTGTEGSIYGTFWLSDYSFAVYGIEINEAFVEVYDIKAKIKTSFTIDKAKRKGNADSDSFFIAKYGKIEVFQLNLKN